MVDDLHSDLAGLWESNDLLMVLPAEASMYLIPDNLAGAYEKLIQSSSPLSQGVP